MKYNFEKILNICISRNLHTHCLVTCNFWVIWRVDILFSGSNSKHWSNISIIDSGILFLLIGGLSFPSLTSIAICFLSNPSYKRPQSKISMIKLTLVFFFLLFGLMKILLSLFVFVGYHPKDQISLFGEYVFEFNDSGAIHLNAPNVRFEETYVWYQQLLLITKNIIFF